MCYAYLMHKRMTSSPLWSRKQVQLLNISFPESGKKHVLVEIGCVLNIRNSKGAGTGTVKDIATHRQTGSVSIVREWDFNSNHFSIDNSESGFIKSWREIEVVPIILARLDKQIFEFNLDVRAKIISPVGSHFKLATCFLPDSDWMLSVPP